MDLFNLQPCWGGRRLGPHTALPLLGIDLCSFCTRATVLTSRPTPLRPRVCLLRPQPLAAGSQPWTQSLAQLSRDLFLCGPRWQPWGGMREESSALSPRLRGPPCPGRESVRGCPAWCQCWHQPVPPHPLAFESHTHLASVQGPSSGGPGPDVLIPWGLVGPGIQI